jgi:hypothetical protein
MSGKKYLFIKMIFKAAAPENSDDVRLAFAVIGPATQGTTQLYPPNKPIVAENDYRMLQYALATVRSAGSRRMRSGPNRDVMPLE